MGKNFQRSLYLSYILTAQILCQEAKGVKYVRYNYIKYMYQISKHY